MRKDHENWTARQVFEKGKGDKRKRKRAPRRTRIYVEEPQKTDQMKEAAFQTNAPASPTPFLFLFSMFLSLHSKNLHKAGAGKRIEREREERAPQAPCSPFRPPSPPLFFDAASITTFPPSLSLSLYLDMSRGCCFGRSGRAMYTYQSRQNEGATWAPIAPPSHCLALTCSIGLGCFGRRKKGDQGRAGAAGRGAAKEKQDPKKKRPNSENEGRQPTHTGNDKACAADGY